MNSTEMVDELKESQMALDDALSALVRQPGDRVCENAAFEAAQRASIAASIVRRNPDALALAAAADISQAAVSIEAQTVRDRVEDARDERDQQNQIEYTGFGAWTSLDPGGRRVNTGRNDAGAFYAIEARDGTASPWFGPYDSKHEAEQTGAEHISNGKAAIGRDAKDGRQQQTELGL